ncbi:MAG: peptide chain release factor N(5)-glutamine methyltransferase [Chitinophagaceae bacterium]
MTANAAQQLLRDQIRHLYEEREASAIAQWVVEDLTGTTRADRLVRDPELTEAQTEIFERSSQQLQAGVPMQYVLGYAMFMGLQFSVNHHVLIPRPETEELVQWLLESTPKEARILDIGSGSGCIPIVISKQRPDASVISIDVSADALAVAKENANRLNARVQWVEGDFLDISVQDLLDHPRVIISNPPYIPISDKDTMAAHIVDHEPHVALFVPDHDALKFYRAIISYGSRYGVTEIFFETHYQLAQQVAALGEGSGYRAEVRKDLGGNERMVRLMR